MSSEKTLVTDNNTPVARLSPYQPTTTDELFKKMRGKIQYFEDLTTPTLEEWQEI
ncbi:hypothetical protein PN462_16260 [Spirulina sp. CS-785/01]|uniref:hypothetical protein n=1 Tax=Spirulina sp. CS-785/01 TaxID=3021716 RepID=UPI0023306185|nr:hypothetical protein [Spirulina sp. CS-785/01]MDB9314667.1 hypothetical protein [Spirulina sp. CS-785/01]